jgi:hypothetical protein
VGSLPFVQRVMCHRRLEDSLRLDQMNQVFSVSLTLLCCTVGMLVKEEGMSVTCLHRWEFRQSVKPYLTQSCNIQITQDLQKLISITTVGNGI